MGAFYTASGLILGAILSIWFAQGGIFFIVLSAGAYRAWLIWEWGKVLGDTIEGPGPLLCMMMQVTVLGVTYGAFGIQSVAGHDFDSNPICSSK
ncbi:hypothetical protein CEP54_015497 [Fusarium duplospermum]|uniref:Uncharacterized protein n=1 Tax=Fusarium duplospermum TaxID=1325734 RepID=A0A428NNR1_9HYPO|nr:hypothetical protein CEP54_015497 [Fusarium duplospermum]